MVAVITGVGGKVLDSVDEGEERERRERGEGESGRGREGERERGGGEGEGRDEKIWKEPHHMCVHVIRK